jgi:hypothetical protein
MRTALHEEHESRARVKGRSVAEKDKARSGARNRFNMV